MKKTLRFFIAASMVLALLTGCAAEKNQPHEPIPTIALPDAGVTGPPAAGHDALDGAAEPIRSPDPGVDVDLTALSSTMVYGEVFQMMLEPEHYIGKTIKMRGLYYASYYEPTGLYYHFVVVEDATACCAQGLEFFWTGERVYPDDYPKDQTEIEVSGVWESYEEEGETYYRIKTDAVRVL